MPRGWDMVTTRRSGPGPVWNQTLVFVRPAVGAAASAAPAIETSAMSATTEVIRRLRMHRCTPKSSGQVPSLPPGVGDHHHVVADDVIPRRLVPDDFVVPERLEHAQFRLRMLSVTDVAKDFAAINERVRPDGTRDPWSETSFLENLADLGWHEVEFKIGRSFAYTVVRPDETEVIGCVYLYPPTDEEHDVDVKMWVTRQAWEEGLDAELERAVRDWVERDWPFQRPFWRER
jgi:RimJ/RimL family protein N-acetyltransferase